MPLSTLVNETGDVAYVVPAAKSEPPQRQAACCCSVITRPAKPRVPAVRVDMLSAYAWKCMAGCSLLKLSMLQFLCNADQG